MEAEAGVEEEGCLHAYYAGQPPHPACQPKKARSDESDGMCDAHRLHNFLRSVAEMNVMFGHSPPFERYGPSTETGPEHLNFFSHVSYAAWLRKYFQHSEPASLFRVKASLEELTGPWEMGEDAQAFNARVHSLTLGNQFVVKKTAADGSPTAEEVPASAMVESYLYSTVLHSWAWPVRDAPDVKLFKHFTPEEKELFPSILAEWTAEAAFLVGILSLEIRRRTEELGWFYISGMPYHLDLVGVTDKVYRAAMGLHEGSADIENRANAKIGSSGVLAFLTMLSNDMVLAAEGTPIMPPESVAQSPRHPGFSPIDLAFWKEHMEEQAVSTAPENAVGDPPRPSPATVAHYREPRIL